MKTPAPSSSEASPRVVQDENESRRVAWIERALGAVPAGSRLLDAGAGEQQFRKFCGHLRYVSQDFAQYDGKGDARGLQTGTWDYRGLDLVCDITAIPEPDRAFDAILCTEVLEHLPDPLAAPREFGRLLRPGGELLVTAPFCSITHFAPYHFATGFNRYYYEHHLPALGFEILEITANGNFFSYLAQETGRLNEMARRHGGGHPGLWGRIVRRLMLRHLRRLAARDAGSGEVLCFGYHVRARRVPLQP